MRARDSVWQGCFGYWQPLFIRENLLPLAHAAWQGFLTQGRGIVACDVEVVDAASVDWSGDVVRYTADFIPKQRVPEYLQSLKLEADLISRLLDAVQTYHPGQEILLLIRGNGQLDINLLQRLAITLPESCRQVSNRWDEFTLPSSAERRSQ